MDTQPNSVQDKVQYYASLEEQNVSNECNLTVNDSVYLEDMDLEESNNIRKRKGESKSDESLEEGWTTISRGRKVFKRAEVHKESSVQVCVTCPRDLPKQFALARLFKEQNINKICKVKYVSSSKILINFEDELSANTFLQTKAFCDLDWKCTKTSEVGISYGVIRNIEMDLSEEDLLKHLSCSGDVISAKRLNKRNTEANGSAWVTSESVRLSFKGQTVPSHIYIYGMRIKVETYTFPVTQCGKCWTYGHSSKFCSSKKVICPKCGDKHENCETIDFKCVNCHGRHMAMHKVCPVYKKEKTIRELMSQYNITYRKALSMYVPRQPVSDRLERRIYITNQNDDRVTSIIHDEPALNSNSAQYSYADTIRNSSRTNQNSQISQQVQEAGHEQNQDTAQLRRQEQRSSKETGQSLERGRQKQKKRKTEQPHTSAFSWANESSETSEDEKRRENKNKPSSKSERDYTFVRLLRELKEVIINSESWDKKIELVVKIVMDWVIPKLVSSMMVRSFIANDHNYA